MTSRKRSGVGFARLALGAIAILLAIAPSLRADDRDRIEPTRDAALTSLHRAGSWFLGWYARTPPAERVTWGGLFACGGLGLAVLLERAWSLRARRIVPPAFTERFVDHLHDGQLDGGQALDHCDRHPSPAARVALAAVRRWGRPAGDLERAVAMAHRVETEGLRRNVATLRRVAVLAAMLGILGTLFALGRALESMPMGQGVTWGPAIASAITPLSTGLIVATLALVAYDGVSSRVETLAGALDRLGAETIEAIAMAAPPAAQPIAMAKSPHFGRVRLDEPSRKGRGKK